MVKRIDMNNNFQEIELESTDKNQRGAQGYVKVATTSWFIGLFSRNVSVTNRKGPELNLNRGSLIDYINKNLDGQKKLKKSWLGLGFFGGTDPKEIQEAFSKVINKPNKDSAQSALSSENKLLLGQSSRADSLSESDSADSLSDVASADEVELPPEESADIDQVITTWAEQFKGILTQKIYALSPNRELTTPSFWKITKKDAAYEIGYYVHSDQVALQVLEAYQGDSWNVSQNILYRQMSTEEIKSILKESNKEYYNAMSNEEEDQNNVIMLVMQKISYTDHVL
jgi:hypothetical protein